MKKLVILGVILLSLSFTVFAQTSQTAKTYEFAGTLSNQDSEIIAGANIIFKKEQQSQIAVTNINGEFKILLSPGDYEITVNQELAATFIAFIKIRENGLNPNNVDFTIETSTDNKYPKPTKIPSAAFPPAALAIGATGEVVVTVVIDRFGKVVSSKAETGHPLLKAASEKAAMNSEFELTELVETREAKLTYVFLMPSNENRNLSRFKNLFRIETEARVSLIQN